MTVTDSRQIAWWAVFELVAPLLGDPHLIPGSPEWCRLGDDDPRKWAALLWCAVYWAITEDGRQEALAEASRAVAASADWPQVAREIRELHDFRAKREAS